MWRAASLEPFTASRARNPGVRSQIAGNFVEQSLDVGVPEQALVHVQPSWPRQSESNVELEHGSWMPLQLFADHVQPFCITQLPRSRNEQPSGVPEQVPESRHPATVLLAVSVSIAHGVGTPEQVGRPEPGPVRSHHPTSPQRVL
jgi:hypothetical protein